MQQGEVPTAVEGAEKVMAIFGRWPSFHDAEILETSQHHYSDASGWDLVVAIHVFESSGKVLESGYYELVNHTRVVLRLTDCDDSTLRNFSNQNVVSGIEFENDPRPKRPLRVNFESIASDWGLDGAVRCRCAEIISAEPYDRATGGERGGPTAFAAS